MWQDWILAAGNAVFVLALVPSILNRQTEMLRITSLTTAGILAVFCATHVTMEMPLASAMNAAGALAWAFLAWRRPIRGIVGEDAAGNVTVDMAITDREWELVMAYRETLARGLQSGGTVGGCGSCPSAGLAPSEIV